MSVENVKSLLLRAMLSRNEFLVHSPLDAAEVQARVTTAVGPKRWFRFPFGTPRFEGAVDGATFDLQLAVPGRTSLKPRMRGAIERSGAGARLVGRIEPTRHAQVFTPVWLCVVSLLACAGLLQASARFGLGLIALWPLVVLALRGYMAWFSRYEVREMVKRLEVLVGGNHSELREVDLAAPAEPEDA